MVLTDREIQAAIQHKQIIIQPVPDGDAYSSTSLDLTLASTLSAWKGVPVAGVEQVICPAASGYKYSEFSKAYSERITMDASGYIIEPHAFVIGATEEDVELPISGRLAARVEGKSAMARLGIGIHVTAPIIHAGFKGNIKLEICNHGPLRVRLVPGMRICQLVFEQTLGTPQKGYAGQFFGQTSS